MWCRISSGPANPGSRSSCLCMNFMINGKSKTPCEWTVLSTRATFLHTDQRWKKWWFFAFESAHNARCDNEDNDNDMMESTKATIIMYHSIPLQHFCFFFYAHIHKLSLPQSVSIALSALTAARVVVLLLFVLHVVWNACISHEQALNELYPWQAYLTKYGTPVQFAKGAWCIYIYIRTPKLIMPTWKMEEITIEWMRERESERNEANVNLVWIWVNVFGLR